MDKTETFIKLCERAEEIQAEKLKYCECRPDSVNLLWWDIRGDCWFNQDNNKTIWLPRQDQLQEMMGEEYSIDLLYAFYHFYNTQADYPIITLSKLAGKSPSMEQLWLAFVMKTRWNKSWNGEDWK